MWQLVSYGIAWLPNRLIQYIEPKINGYLIAKALIITWLVSYSSVQLVLVDRSLCGATDFHIPVYCLSDINFNREFWVTCWRKIEQFKNVIDHKEPFDHNCSVDSSYAWLYSSRSFEKIWVRNVSLEISILWICFTQGTPKMWERILLESFQ